MLNISLDEIKIKLPAERTLLSGINFSLGKNQLFTILGKNGSGKSTFLKAVPKLLDEHFYSVKGKIDFMGKDIFKMNESELLDLRRTKIKYVMQDALNSFDHLKKFKYYFDNITEQHGSDHLETEDLLKYFILPAPAKLFNLYPYEVSGGMAQRISFVLALLSHPDIILLDEPTSGIDSAIANLFLLKLKEFTAQNSNAAMLVTHDIVFAKKAGDKIALLSEGKLSEFAAPDEFFNNYSVLFLNELHLNHE